MNPIGDPVSTMSLNGTTGTQDHIQGGETFIKEHVGSLSVLERRSVVCCFSRRDRGGTDGRSGIDSITIGI
jgi:hypothetical protein